MDTGAFIALAVSNDPNHQSARRLYESLVQARVPVLLTNHIVDETCTWLMRDRSMGHRAAVTFGKYLLENAEAWANPASSSKKLLRVIYSSQELERRAWEIFNGYETAGFTFTDCVSFAAMELASCKRAFTYDSHFEIYGYERIG